MTLLRVQPLEHQLRHHVIPPNIHMHVAPQIEVPIVVGRTGPQCWKRIDKRTGQPLTEWRQAVGHVSLVLSNPSWQGTLSIHGAVETEIGRQNARARWEEDNQQLGASGAA